MMNRSVEISVIIVSWNQKDLLRACLRSLYSSSGSAAIEVIVVDNASSDGSATMVEIEFPQALVIRAGENLGFGRATNLGASRARGKYLLLLNSDTEVCEDTCSKMADFMTEHPDVGIVGCRLVDPVGRAWQRSYGNFPTWRAELCEALFLSSIFPRSRIFEGTHIRSESAIVRACDWVSGAAMMIRRSAWDAVRGFDEAFFMYYEDVDLCWRVRAAGFTVVFFPFAHVIHHQGASVGKGSAGLLFDLESQRIFCRKHYSRVHCLLIQLVVALRCALRVAVFPALAVVSGRYRGRQRMYARWRMFCQSIMNIFR